ncbi:MAG: hypothetical protein LQ346_003775 [Caloplaca aetnensis]|nr:MAG: hypothetical protein LQ346_003775 [Caloplaca aetnensis]
MLSSPPSFYALIATLLMICFERLPTSSALPASSNSDAVPLSKIQSRSLDNWYQCYDQPGFVQRRAKYNDCARTAAQLPNLVEPKTFHRGGDPFTDPYALPIVKIHNTCQIKVDLKFGRSDESSWLGIDIALSKIMEACSLGYGQHETTGGEIVAGSHDFIIVTVGRTVGGTALDTAATGDVAAVATS